MRAVRVFILACIAAVVSTASSTGGPCEEVRNNLFSFGSLKYCFMMSTAINSTNFMITSDRDETVDSFYAVLNNKLEYLPNNLGAKLPNLLILYAQYCSIKEVTRDNFEGLSKMRHLKLHNNQIEKINDDTFEYIPAVEMIHFADNKIKKLNGRAFASLHKLTYVSLSSNECIDDNFDSATRIAEMSRVVSEKCGDQREREN